MPWSFSTNPSKIAAAGRNKVLNAESQIKKVTFPGATEIYHEIKRRKEEEKQVTNEDNA